MISFQFNDDFWIRNTAIFLEKFADLWFGDWDAKEICGSAICGLIVTNLQICDLRTGTPKKLADLRLRNETKSKKFACPPLECCTYHVYGTSSDSNSQSTCCFASLYSQRNRKCKTLARDDSNNARTREVVLMEAIDLLSLSFPIFYLRGNYRVPSSSV